MRDLRRQHVDQHVDADMDAGAHAIGGAELRHPDEHVDAEFLRPRHVEVGEPGVDARAASPGSTGTPCAVAPLGEIDGEAGAVAVQHGEEDQRRSRPRSAWRSATLPDDRARADLARNPPSLTKSAGSVTLPAAFLIMQRRRPSVHLDVEFLGEQIEHFLPTRPLAHL